MHHRINFPQYGWLDKLDCLKSLIESKKTGGTRSRAVDSDAEDVGLRIQMRDGMIKVVGVFSENEVILYMRMARPLDGWRYTCYRASSGRRKIDTKEGTYEDII